MDVLILGGGGREHALAWALRKSPDCGRLVVAPGNAGIAALAECAPLAIEDGAAVAAFARAGGFGLVVVGPEAPLAAGVADALAAAGVLCFGPTQAAARLEASKAFTKEICDAVGAPTAAWARFAALGPAQAHVRGKGAPIVVKADGLAAGKGVTVAESVAEAEAALEAIFGGAFGPGAEAVIEEKLTGAEVSLFVLSDGARARVLGSAQDHKRAFDGDRGPNTGGMGAISPAPALSAAAEAAAMDRIVRPVLAEMARRGAPFRGVLFAGLMVERDAPKLIEFNVRFGDPETEALLLRLGGDLLPLLRGAAEGRLPEAAPPLRPVHAAAVVMAARGYPGDYARGEPIGGLEAAAAEGAEVFHAGTALREGAVVSNGGRVLVVAAEGETAAAARARAYAAVARIDWPGGFFRSDIGGA